MKKVGKRNHILSVLLTLCLVLTMVFECSFSSVSASEITDTTVTDETSAKSKEADTAEEASTKSEEADTAAEEASTKSEEADTAAEKDSTQGEDVITIDAGGSKSVETFNTPVTSKTLTDAETKVSVTFTSDAIPEDIDMDDVTLKVTALSESEAKAVLASAHPDDYKVSGYDISLVDGEGNAVKLSKEVKVSIPIPEGFGDNIFVMHKKSDGTTEEIACTNDGGYAVFEIESFSPFVLTYEEDASKIKDKLTTDDAYVSYLGVSSIEDGTEDFDADDSAGNDSGKSNKIVRTFDTVTYNIAYSDKVYSDGIAYKEGYIWFKFVLPLNEEQATFQTSAMTWMATDDEHMWSLTVDEENNTQTLICAKLIEAVDGAPSALPGSGTADLQIKIGAMNNNEEVQPEMYAWMDHNTLGKDNTASDVCETHAGAKNAGNEVVYK